MAWYLRAPDLPAFLRRIAPVLERRLAASPFARHTTDLRLSFYRCGVRLSFAAGRLAAEPWRPSHPEEVDAAFPDLTFLKLLFGYRALDELEYMFADCWAGRPETRALLQALFPRLPSLVWPLG